MDYSTIFIIVLIFIFALSAFTGLATGAAFVLVVAILQFLVFGGLGTIAALPCK